MCLHVPPAPCLSNSGSRLDALCIGVPVGYNCFIHVWHILERSVAEPDDIGVVEVSVGCKEHPASIKFKIHNFFIHAHLCAVNKLIICNNSTCGRNWRRRAHRANVTNRHQTKTVEKFGKNSPTVFIYRFSGIPASFHPRWSIKHSSENVSISIECSNARSMDIRQPLKAFYASIRYDVPVVHSSLLHCKLYVFVQLTAQNYGFSWGAANFFREKPI